VGAPKFEYDANGHKYNIGYFLSDDIYPRWAAFVKTIPLPQGAKAKLFIKRQESVGKDVKRAFGILQAHFAIIHGPARNTDKAELGMTMKACIVLHNMIAEDERDSYDLSFEYDDEEDNTPQPNIEQNHHPYYTTYLHRVQVQHPDLHAHFQFDLVKEI